jgi:hypothetical protein
MNEGMNVTEACAEVGMARGTYYYITKREEEAITVFLEIINAIILKIYGRSIKPGIFYWKK